MIRIRDISLPPDGDMARLVQAAARQLRISPNEIKQLDLKRRSVDARKKNDVRIIYTVDVAVKGREDKILKMAHCARASLAQDPVYHVPQPRSIPAQRPVIVGFGPAGMFAALVLSMAGLRPLVLERRGTQPCWNSGRPGRSTRSATCSSVRAARGRSPTGS